MIQALRVTPDGFEHRLLSVRGVKLHAVVGGTGTPLALVHGAALSDFLPGMRAESVSCGTWRIGSERAQSAAICSPPLPRSHLQIKQRIQT